MRAHDWFIEHRPDFVAGALEPGDEALFRDHLARCADCRAAAETLTADLAWLPLAAAPVAPRPGFAQRVVREVAHPQPRRRPWIWPLATAASLLLALAVWRADAARIAALEEELAASAAALAASEATLVATRDTLQVAFGADRVLQASIELGGMRGGLLILADETTHRWKVVVHGIPAAPADQRYTFWFITGDGMVHGAEVICDERNPAVLMLDMPAGAQLIKGGALTIEPRAGDLSVPRGTELAHLEM